MYLLHISVLLLEYFTKSTLLHRWLYLGRLIFVSIYILNLQTLHLHNTPTFFVSEWQHFYYVWMYCFWLVRFYSSPNAATWYQPKISTPFKPGVTFVPRSKRCILIALQKKSVTNEITLFNKDERWVKTCVGMKHKVKLSTASSY